jgi:hypothetical protein
MHATSCHDSGGTESLTGETTPNRGLPHIIVADADPRGNRGRLMNISGEGDSKEEGTSATAPSIVAQQYFR